MKESSRISSLAAGAVLAVSLSVFPINTRAQTWTGNVDNDFNNPSNWSAALGTNSTLQINSTGSQGNTTLTNAGYTFTGTGGKIAFGSTAPAMTLSGGTLNFINTTVDALNVDVSNTNTITIASDSVLGNGTAGTISFTSRNTGGGLLLVSGNVTGGTGGTPGALVLSLGSTSSNNGNYEFTGNMNRGGATSMQLTKRGNGTATLSGTNVFVNMGNNEAGSTLRVFGGQTNILNAAGGGFGVANQGSSSIRVSSGELNAFDARNVRNSLLVDGGTFNIGQAYNESGVLQSNTTGGARLSFNSAAGAPTYSFTIASGNVNYLPTYATNNFGIRLGNDSGAGNSGNATTEASVTALQTGGTFVVNGAGGQDSTFSLGTATANRSNSYSLSGGQLDIRGTGTNAFLAIGADTAGTGNSTFGLSGTGKLIVRSATTAGSPGSGSVSGIQGRNTSGVQVLSLTGGTLVAGRIDATNLRGSLAAANGTIVNNGTGIAPGDTGFSGRTSVVGNLEVVGGSMLMDVFGTTPATLWQDSSPDLFDNIQVTGSLTYGGILSLNFGSYTPEIGNSFNLFDFGSQSGTFSSITFSNPGFEGSFDYGTGVLTISAIPEPTVWAMLGLAAAAFAGYRIRSRKS